MKDDLYNMWCRFRGARDEVERLEQLTGLDRNQCIDLSQSFWKRWTHENSQDAL